MALQCIPLQIWVYADIVAVHVTLGPHTHDDVAGVKSLETVTSDIV